MRHIRRISICHTTARRDVWHESFLRWMRSAQNPQNVEYVLTMDARWDMDETDRFKALSLGVDKVVWNNGRMCMVDGYHPAVAVSRGELIVLNSDDVFPPLYWDYHLERAVRKAEKECTDDFVVRTKSGTPADQRNLMIVQILSRGRLDRLGYALWPEYESMYADDDFSEHAAQDGVVIDATNLLFEHRHPMRPEQMDAVYLHQNRLEAYDLGRRILERRRANRFGENEAKGESKANGGPPPMAVKAVKV